MKNGTTTLSHETYLNLPAGTTVKNAFAIKDQLALAVQIPSEFKLGAPVKLMPGTNEPHDYQILLVDPESGVINKIIRLEANHSTTD